MLSRLRRKDLAVVMLLLGALCVMLLGSSLGRPITCRGLVIRLRGRRDYAVMMMLLDRVLSIRFLAVDLLRAVSRRSALGKMFCFERVRFVMFGSVELDIGKVLALVLDIDVILLDVKVNCSVVS